MLSVLVRWIEAGLRERLNSLQYFIKSWRDGEGRDNRARGAFREGCEHMLPSPRHAGVWSRPKPLNLDDLPKRIREPLERDGYYLETLPMPLEKGASKSPPPAKPEQH